MRADKDFRTYEQALTFVQRLGDLAEADHKKGKHQEAQYNLSKATFVGVKHLLFMAADAALDRTEARELAANNHLAIVNLLTLAVAGLGGEGAENGSAERPVVAAKPKRRRRGAASART